MSKDIRLQIGFLDHPKTMRLQLECGPDGVFSLLRLWFFAAQNKPKGVLKGMDEIDIELAAKWTGESGKFVETILKENCKWLIKKNKVFSLNNWEKHQGWVYHSKERSKKAKKAAKLRWEKDSCNEHATSITQLSSAYAPNPSPSPLPNPSPIPSPKIKNVKDICPEGHNIPFKEIIEDLNSKTGKKYRSTSKDTQVLIRARWEEGFRLEDFEKVHKYQVDKWKDDSKMSEYLRPATLYSASKFEGYLNTPSNKPDVCCNCESPHRPADQKHEGKKYCRECYPWEKDYVDAEGNPSTGEIEEQ